MAIVLQFDELMAMATSVGIPLREAPVQAANLYVLVDPDGNDIYVGKASSARRHLYEDAPFRHDWRTRITSGFVALTEENRTTRRALRYEPERFDFDTLTAVVGGWEGALIDVVLRRMSDREPLTLDEVEEALIRMHVASGRLISNSGYASQWDSPLGRVADTIAQIAVERAFESGVLQRHGLTPPDAG